MTSDGVPKAWHARWRSVAATVAAYVVLAVIALGANPFAGRTVGPFDLLVSQPGWAGTRHDNALVRSFERTDVLDALLPRWIFARNELRSGRVPVWNPLPGGGEAGMQNLASAQLNPAFALFALAPSPASGFYAATLFNLVMAACGAHLWLRRRLGVAGAAFGGVTVMLCGFNTAWLFWPHVLTSVWICWLLWAVDAWWRDGHAWRFGAVVATATLLILGGFPFVTELGLGAAVLQVVMLAWLERDVPVRRRVGGIVAALALAFGLCAVPLIAVGRWLANVDVTYRVGGSSLRFFPDANLLMPLGARHAPLVESTMYAGALGVLLALTGAVLAFHRFRAKAFALAFPLALLAVGLVMTFELVPHAWLARVPGLGTNPWSRAIVILDLGLAAVAAFAVDWIFSRVASRPAAWTVAITLIGIQAIDLGSFFRLFNGPVPSAYFYPSTPLLERVQAGAGPFDGVIADHNYLVSGTLGAYGLREWFGHGFKSRATKGVLSRVADRPFTTPTASILTAGQLDLSSPALRALGIRYLLGGRDLISHSIVPEFTPGSMRPMVALPALGTMRWTQRFTLLDTYPLTGIALRLATYGGHSLHGTVSLSIRSANEPAVRLGSSRMAAADVVDGAMARFTFAPALTLPPGDYDLTLAYEEGGPGEAMTAWYTPGHGEHCALLAEPAMPEGCLIMQWLSERTDVREWTQIAQDGSLLLFENRQTPTGPYFIDTLLAFPDAQSTANVKVVPGPAHGWVLEYNGQRPGFVVLPMSSNAAWHFLLDGKEVHPVLYLGALSGIRVTGQARIDARYDPLSIRWGRWIAGAAFLITLLLMYWLVRRER